MILCMRGEGNAIVFNLLLASFAPPTEDAIRVLTHQGKATRKEGAVLFGMMEYALLKRNNCPCLISGGSFKGASWLWQKQVV